MDEYVVSKSFLKVQHSPSEQKLVQGLGDILMSIMH